MAGLFTDSKKAELTRKLIAWACSTYGFEPAQYHSSQVDVKFGGYKMAFKPRRYPPDIVALANRVHDVMNDPLRGEVVRAVVPELSADAAALADAILNQKMHVIDVDYGIIEQLTKT